MWAKKEKGQLGVVYRLLKAATNVVAEKARVN
jgi:hypothetical protein